MADPSQPNVTMTDEQFKKLMAQKSTPASAPAGSSPLDKLTAPVEALGKGFEKVQQYAQDSAATFMNLSQTGNSFNNDMIGLKVAAANARVSTEDFADILSTSGKTFSGLGGNVAKGGQVFGEFSKTFFDSGLTENLRQMGYTSKDLNEVLASQIGFQKSTTDTSVEGQLRTSAAAAELATEMDLIAKQTGKSRKEQEAILEKAKTDGQVEAKMRLIGIQQGADAEKAARENYAKKLLEAEAQGMGQGFKEVFATGTVRSQEAATQAALLGDAFRENANSAKALSRGNVEESNAAMERAKVANVANQKNEAILNATVFGSGAVADVGKKYIESNDTMYHGVKKTADATGIALKNTEDFGKALGANKTAIQAEQQARHGATAAYITSAARLQDLAAAGANKIAAINKGETNKQLLEFSGNSSQGVKAGDTAKQTKDAYAQALRNQASMGGADAAPVSSRQKYEAIGKNIGVDKAVNIADQSVGGVIQGGGKVVDKVGNFFSDVMNVKELNTKESRDGGTIEKTGQPFEPADFFGKIHKGEMVLTPKQAQDFMSGAKTEGAASAAEQLAKSMPKLDMSMFKDIQTRITNAGSDDKMSDEMLKMQDRVKAEVAKMQEATQGPVSMKDIQANMAKGMGQEEAQKAAETKAAKTAQAQPFDKTKFQMPSMGQLTIGPDGMPRVMPKAAAASIPSAIDKKKEDDFKRIGKEQGAEAEEKARKEASKTDTPGSKEPAAAKTATQDDITKLLTSLNTTMNKVYTAITDTNSKLTQQVKATKAMSGNAYDRT